PERLRAGRAAHPGAGERHLCPGRQHRPPAARRRGPGRAGGVWRRRTGPVARRRPGRDEVRMRLPPLPGHSWVKSLPPGPALAVAVSVVLGMIYADMAFAVIDPADYRFFPPFQRGHNANLSRTQGGETYEIAKALLAGEGFAHPMRERT